MDKPKRLVINVSNIVNHNMEQLARHVGMDSVEEILAESLGMIAGVDQGEAVLTLIENEKIEDRHRITIDVDSEVAENVSTFLNTESLTLTEAIRLSVGQIAVKSGFVSLN